MTESDSTKTMRTVLDACADCDICRYLMDESCLMFPELYRLYDVERETGSPVKGDDLRKLSELCTFCGLCPCPNIRAVVIQSKTEQVLKDGVLLNVRLLSDVQRLGKWGSLMSTLVNTALSFSPIPRLVKKIVGIHPKRSLPRLAGESFFAWARRKGLNRESNSHPRVAYFAGCTAGYLFPEVGRAAVAVLLHNGVSVHVPPQQCCGMPTLLEGDKPTTLERLQFNLEILLQTVRKGYDLVSSCPTCGYLMKILLREKAYFSKAYQETVAADIDEILVPDRKAGNEGFIRIKKSMYQNILKDDSYFSSLDPLKRIALSESFTDIGEYLRDLHHEKFLNPHFGKIEGRMVYYAPCHQREQEIESPYPRLLAMIPGLTIQPVGSATDCCGMGGSLGFKEGFHEASVSLGKTLTRKIQAAKPNAVITDCLSCRLQFQHMMPYTVYHPLEIVAQSYKNAEIRDEK